MMRKNGSRRAPRRALDGATFAIFATKTARRDTPTGLFCFWSTASVGRAPTSRRGTCWASIPTWATTGQKENYQHCEHYEIDGYGAERVVRVRRLLASGLFASTDF
jgi:hypothetical protein